MIPAALRASTPRTAPLWRGDAPPWRAAFTLVELLLVLTALGVIAAIAVPRMTGVTSRYRLEAAAARLAQDVEFAQRRARATSASRELRFNKNTDQYQIVGEKDVSRKSGSFLVNVAQPPYECDIVSVDLGGDDSLIFDGYGQPDSGGEVELASGNLAATLLFEATSGKVTLEWK